MFYNVIVFSIFFFFEQIVFSIILEVICAERLFILKLKISQICHCNFSLVGKLVHVHCNLC